MSTNSKMTPAEENLEPVMMDIGGKVVDIRSLKASDHPKALSPVNLVACVIISCAGAVVGLEIMARVGVSQNTSIIGALLAIIVSMIPGKVFSRFKNIHSQNLMQTSISGASYAAANAMLLPIGIPVLMGRSDLMYPLLIGVTVATLIDGAIIYKIFDSPMYPASAPWPQGVATSETILAMIRKGKKSLYLFAGIAMGIGGKMLGIPMDLMGVSWFGNIAAMTAFGIGSLVVGAVVPAWSAALGATDAVPVMLKYLPHGIMIGAGAVSLIQAGVLLVRKKSSLDVEGCSVEQETMKNALVKGFLAYLATALLLAVATGLYTEMKAPMFILWIVFAAVAAIASELVVGLSSMHSGWFPSMATALIFLVLGILIGFPDVPLAILVAYTAATGPAFTDMSNDLKAGWVLRGRGINLEFEREGRKQQFISEIIGYGVAFVLVALLANSYFSQGLFIPVSKTYVATIEAGASAEIAKWLLVWAIPGALLQLIGGHRQLGIMFATGMLVGNTINGVTVIIALAVRLAVQKLYKEKGQELLYVLGAGSIAGAALYSFFSSTVKLFAVKKD